MEERPYSHDIADAIESFLIGEARVYAFDADEGIFNFGMNLKGKLKFISYNIVVNRSSYDVVAKSPIGADASDQKMMSNMSMFTNRASCDIEYGCLHFDPDGGSVYYSIRIDCPGKAPSEDSIRCGISIASDVFEKYGNGILDIALSGKSDKEAFHDSKQSYFEGMFKRIEEYNDKRRKEMQQELERRKEKDSKEEPETDDDENLKSRKETDSEGESETDDDEDLFKHLFEENDSDDEESDA